MNWKQILTSVIAVVIALIVWELFVKNLVVHTNYEGNYFDEYEMKKAS